MSYQTLVTDLFPLIVECNVPDVEKLIDKGGKKMLDVNIEDNRIKIGIKALFYAFEENQPHLVKFILDVANQIATCWAESQYGEYAYIFDIIDEQNIPNSEIIRKIVSSPFGNIILNAVTDSVSTSLVFLSMIGKHLEVKTLLDAGVDTEVTNIDLEAFSWLILTYFGMYVRPLHTSIWTPLMLASDFGRSEVVEMLIEAGANIEAHNEKGETPLILASTKNHIKVVSLLLDANANVEAKDTDGNTAYEIAKIKNHTIIAEMIENQLPTSIGCPEEYYGTEEENCNVSYVAITASTQNTSSDSSSSNDDSD